MPSIEDYEAVGLYDPEVDGDTGRLELLRWLDEQGFSIDDLVHALETDALGAIVGDRALVPADLLTRADAIEQSGLDPDDFDALSTALGYVPVDPAPPGEIGYSPSDVETFASFGAISSMFSRDEALGLIRVFGASVTRMAEASVSLFLADVESPHLASQGSELDLALKAQDAVALLDGLMAALDPVMRRQVLQAIERTRRATIGFDERFVYRYAIGFVDLVGYTSLSGDLDGPELAAFLRDFEGRAIDAVTKAGARVVKLIGDEVMFAATDPIDACAAARGLLDAFTGTADILPRGGLAFGDVLVRGGDYYGSIVNLASRLVGEAVPQEVLATDDFVEAAPNCKFTPAGRRMVRGFADPVTVWSLEA